MPAGNSTRTRTRSRAGCTGSASRWSTRCRRGWTCASSATGANGRCAFTTACPRRRWPRSARRRRCRPARASPPVPRSPFCRARPPSPAPSLTSRRSSTGYANWPSSTAASPWCSPTCASRSRNPSPFTTRAGWRRSSPISTARSSRCMRRRSRSAANATASSSRSRWNGPTRTTSRCCALPTTSRSATAAPTLPASAPR